MEEAFAAVIERAKAGDADAFRLLVERHSRAIFRLAYRMTGNEFDAEDVVQETFLRAYRQLDSYELRSAFSTWLYRIASNYALDMIRSRKRDEDRRARQAEGDSREILDSLASTEALPDRRMYGAEVRERVQRALAELSPQERTAFLLRHFEGQSIEEIGAVLGTAGSATKNAIFRAVRKLREALTPVVGSYDAARNG